MGNIVLLDELTINKIAAGEVIERPASVVKEMVENSIDADAKHITIEIKNGGISFIRISDDGKGIAKDDTELAFERHATSKIRSSDDLNTVKSMGFRGEALASIASIANVELVTRTATDSIGSQIIVEGGDVISAEEIGCPQGTTITVRNLFFNTPVRYKFLKKDFTESGYIEDVVTRIALIHPEISIKLINSGKTIISTNGSGNLIDTIYNIYGREIASNLISVDYEYENIKIKGVIGKPIIARSNRSNQIFFVNKRYIKDKTMSSAVEQAFKGLLPIGKFPFLILNVEMDPSKVDVNVHPAKLEVRFSEENIVFKAIYHSIKDTFLKNDIKTEREKTAEAKEASKDAFKIQNAEELSKKTYSVQSAEDDNDFVPAVFKNTNIATNEQFVEQLKELQATLKKEVENNPNLHLTDKYKEMEQKYNEIISTSEDTNISSEKQEKEEINQSNNEATIKIENSSIIENTEISTQNEQNVENTDSENAIGEQNNLNNDIEQQEENNSSAYIEVQEDNTTLDDKSEENKLSIKENEEENTNIENTGKTEDDDNTEKETNSKMPSFEEMYRNLFGKEPYTLTKNKEEVEERKENYYTIDSNMQDNNVSMFEDNQNYNKVNYKFVGIAFNTYIIFEMENELYIMDQHAAHERILYERVKENFYDDREKSSQLLLLPDIITLTHKEMDIAKDNMYLFRRAGFMLEEFGENTIKLNGVPDICIDLNTEELFKETLDEINTIARTAKQEKEEKFLATVACKAAVKAKMVLTKEEVDSLMNQLLELPNPFTCPHGRPTIIKMSKYEIERKFARK